MAIAFDASGSVSNDSSSPITWTHTCTGSNGILIVALVFSDAGIKDSTATYNGIAMSPLNNEYNTNITSTHPYTAMFYLLNPPTGSAFTVSITSSPGGGSSNYSGLSASYTGVAGVGSLGGAVATTGTATTTGSVEGFSGAWLVGVFNSYASSGTFSSPSGNSRKTVTGSSFTDAGMIQDMAFSGSTATLTATAPSSTNWITFAAVLIPVGDSHVALASAPGPGNGYGRTTGATTTLSTSFNNTLQVSGSNYMAVVVVAMALTTTAGTVTCSVTYGGTSMTQLDLQQGAAASGNEAIGIYYLANPATGAQSVSVTTGGTTTKQSVIGACITYVGPAALQLNGEVNDTNTNNAPTMPAVTSDANSRVLAAFTRDSAAWATWPNSGRLQEGGSVTGTGDFLMLNDKMGSASTTIATTTSTSTRWRVMGVNVTAITTPTNLFFGMWN